MDGTVFNIFKKSKAVSFRTSLLARLKCETVKHYSTLIFFEFDTPYLCLFIKVKLICDITEKCIMVENL